MPTSLGLSKPFAQVACDYGGYSTVNSGYQYLRGRGFSRRWLPPDKEQAEGQANRAMLSSVLFLSVRALDGSPSGHVRWSTSCLLGPGSA